MPAGEGGLLLRRTQNQRTFARRDVRSHSPLAIARRFGRLLLRPSHFGLVGQGREF